MSQGGYVTLVGYVAREPMLRSTKDGTSVADVRIGTTTRYLDRELDLWRDGDTSYYSVNCWRRLADNVRASLHKGDPVIVKGKFRTRTYTDKEGTVKTEAEIVADTIGHDLSRGCANFLRPQRTRPESSSELTAGEMSRSGGDYEGDPEDPDEDVTASRADLPPFADPGSGLERSAEEDAEEFSAGDVDAAVARELTEPEETALPF
jgi:single-strand DNA-binding protein